jgi:hypothetical protein
LALTPVKDFSELLAALGLAARPKRAKSVLE